MFSLVVHTKICIPTCTQTRWRFQVFPLAQCPGFHACKAGLALWVRLRATKEVKCSNVWEGNMEELTGEAVEEFVWGDLGFSLL